MGFLVPALGTVSYNGIAFSSDTETINFSARQQWDAAMRTVIYTVYNITIKGRIIDPSGGSTDVLMTVARQKLNQPGGQFQYTNRGFGAFTVNVPGGPKDVVWGPKPHTWRFKPTSNIVAEITWSVEIAIPEHCSNVLFEKALMEFNFRVDTQITDGYTNRTVTGHLRIPQTRRFAGDTALHDSADNYFEKVVPSVPNEFRRRVISRTLSYDKCRLDFSFVDEEMASPLPAGVMHATGEHSLSSAVKGLRLFTGTVSASYELQKNSDVNTVAKHFLSMALERAERTRTSHYANAVLPIAFRASNPGLYGKPKATFSLTYTFVLKEDWTTALAAGNLWGDISGLDYDKWKQSMANGAHHPLGYAKMKFSETEDAIIDLCLSKKPNTLRASLLQFPGRDAEHQLVAMSLPNPNQSWVAYENQLRSQPQDNIVALRALPAKVDEPRPVENVVGDPDPDAAPPDLGLEGVDFKALEDKMANPLKGNKLQPNFPPKKNICKIQRRGDPLMHVYMNGHALRAGYEIPAPNLIQVGGAKATPDNNASSFFNCWVIANAGVPIYAAVWNLRYLLSDMPDKEDVPPNPLLGKTKKG